MATVTGLTAERMLEIEASSVVDGEVIAGNLILQKYDGTPINAGSVVGPQGPQGPQGDSVDYVGDWAPGIPYTRGQVVHHEGVDYIAVNPSTGQEPPVVTGLIVPGLIEEIILTGPEATINFDNIPATYRHLQLIGSLIGDQVAARSCYLSFNGDFADGNYNAAYQQQPASGTSGTSRLCGLVNNPGSLGPAPNRILVFDYTSGLKKSAEVAAAYRNPNIETRTGHLYWSGVSVIDRITITPDVGGFVAGSKMQLYGIL